MSHDRRAPRHRLDRPTEAEPTLAGLSLGRWDQVRHHLLARLVPNDRAGPIAIRPPTVAGFAPSPVVFDVGIDVAGGIVRLDQALIEAFDVDRRVIWSAAVANLDNRDRPPAIIVETEPARLAIVAGGPWTTGLLLRTSRLTSIVDRVPGSPASIRSLPGPAPVLVVAPHPEVLVVGQPTGLGRSGRQRRELARLADAALDVAAALAAADGGARLPLAPLLPLASAWEGSFPDRRSLE